MDDAYKVVENIMNEGYKEFDNENYSDAITHFTKAWDAVPEPREEWEEGDILWLMISTSYSRMQDHENALKALKKAQSCYRGDLNSQLHFSMGQIYLDHFNKEDLAAEHFNKAWDLSEGRAFQGEDPKYVKFARGK